VTNPFQHEGIWNRAALERGGPSPLEGDRALAAMLFAHGLVMNGGVVHALEVLDPNERSHAIAGYRYFGVFSAASVLAQEYDDSEECELRLDAAYHRAVPNDAILMSAFRKLLVKSP
jgi:hypothetical protein